MPERRRGSPITATTAHPVAANGPYLDSVLEVADVPGAEPRVPRGGVDATRSTRSEFDEVVDSDVDLHDERQRQETRPRQWDLVLATAAGGVLGAEARYGVAVLVPHASHQFPWSTVLINASGCLLIGALMVSLLELTSPHRLVRPFLGVGVLGGYTTYSTFAVDVQQLVLAHRPVIALAYVTTTVLACAIAVWLSTTATLVAGRAVIARRVRRRDLTRRSS
ncbi:MAG: CrcB family protein [Actinomycetota bacterium]|nr:CrcB family protein [Actinomycetota bacterium]